MARINVFLPDDLLAAIDAEAAGSRVARSALIQEALQSLLDARGRERQAEEARRRMDEACRSMDALADKLGDWDPVAIVRRFRDQRDSPERRAAGRAKR